MTFKIFLMVAVVATACIKKSTPRSQDRVVQIEPEAKTVLIKPFENFLGWIFFDLSTSKPENEIPEEEKKFFAIYDAFLQKCQLWFFITKPKTQPLKDADYFSVDVSAKYIDQKKEDTSNLGSHPLGKIALPKTFDDFRDRLPTAENYHLVTEVHASLSVFMKKIKACLPNSTQP